MNRLSRFLRAELHEAAHLNDAYAIYTTQTKMSPKILLPIFPSKSRPSHVELAHLTLIGTKRLTFRVSGDRWAGAGRNVDWKITRKGIAAGANGS
jgi:hypothetical protein